MLRTMKEEYLEGRMEISLELLTQRFDGTDVGRSLIYSIPWKYLEYLFTMFYKNIYYSYIELSTSDLSSFF